MYSIPDLHRVLGATLLSLAFIGGCSSMPDSPVPDSMRHGYSAAWEDRVNAAVRPSQARLEPVLPDPAPDVASTLRGWDTVVYRFPSGGVVAYPTYAANYEDRPAWLQNDYLYALVSPGILLADVAALPFWLVVEPPFTEVTYHGTRYPASMTVAPPLPNK